MRAVIFVQNIPKLHYTVLYPPQPPPLQNQIHPERLTHPEAIFYPTQINPQHPSPRRDDRARTSRIRPGAGRGSAAESARRRSMLPVFPSRFPVPALRAAVAMAAARHRPAAREALPPPPALALVWPACAAGELTRPAAAAPRRRALAMHTGASSRTRCFRWRARPSGNCHALRELRRSADLLRLRKSVFGADSR